MGIKLSNNAFATLATGINSSATSITVASGQGARFPTLTASDYFYATLVDTSNNLEIVKCTARSTDVLTVVRAQESTTARAYSTGDRIEIRITAQTFLDATSLPSQTGNSGKFLTTNGTDPSWGAVSITPTAVSDQTNSSTGYFDLPSGTTAQRPASPAAGMIRHNTTTGYVEYWDTGTSQWLGIGAFAATGGTITTAGSYTYHTFTSSGSLTVSAGAKSADILIVAGGGGGGGSGVNGGGGGGAGGLVSTTATLTTSVYTVTVGGGGAHGSTGSNGVASAFTGSTSAVGGGGGATAGGAGNSGGSGGGRGRDGGTTAQSNGTAGQGNAGGASAGATCAGAGGGGGAGAVGSNGATDCSATARTGGGGGIGINWQSLGTFYAGGGGGSFESSNSANGGAPGGSGGGGNGSITGAGISATAGSANTGGGGGGGQQGVNGGNGGSGIVIIRYLTL